MSTDASTNGKPSSKTPRSQFHYFYGSTSDNDMTAMRPSDALALNNSIVASGAEGENVQNEQDSLVGEELISTDNEGEETTALVNGAKKKTTQDLNALPPLLCSARSVIVLLLVAIATAGFVVLLIPHTSDPLPKTQTFTIPFPLVDRSEYGDPVEEFIDMDLFHPSLIAPPETPHAFVFPFPTGAFWTNLIVKSPEGAMSYPVAVYPYAYRWSSSSLHLSYPAGHRVVDKHTIQDTFAPDLKLTTVEEINKRHVTQFDPLSVTLRFVASSDSKWETALVHGSPYITMQYLTSTPVFSPLSIFSAVQCPGNSDENFSDLFDDTDDSTKEGKTSGGFQRDLFGVCSIDEESDETYTTMRGVQFIFRTPEGTSWIMFASEPMNLVFDKVRKTTISSSAPYTGVIRLAYIPGDEKTFDSSTGLRRLIYHSAIYPVGGQVSFAASSSSSSTSTTTKTDNGDSSRHATVTFSYATRSMVSSSLQSSSNNNLLMLALPHHAELLSKTVKLSQMKFDLEYKCIKGKMTPVIGSTWSYDEPLFDLAFDSGFNPVDNATQQLILQQVNDDLDRVLPTFAENVYGYGKQVARLAQLAHIADRLEPKSLANENITESNSVLGKATKVLSYYLESYLSSKVSDGLLFDSKMGGLVSNNGLHDKGEDFGNGRYNDHHFHYGYLLYASAILGRIDPSFIERYGPHVDAIFHDIAHTENGDSSSVTSGKTFFPMTRHKSWFDGHSYATGLFPFGNGKSQESSSEAINAYYGAYLWSFTRHKEVASDLTDFSRLLLAMEIRGAKTYWHMVPESVSGNSSATRLHVYPSKFEENYMVGNVGMLDVAVNTWFGTDPLYIHMINAIPITAITNVLFEKDYVQYEYPFLMDSRSSVEMAWRGYTTAVHSIIDPQQAWKEAQDLVSFELDAALSKSQVLYFISQQPGFRVTGNNASIDTKSQKKPSTYQSAKSVSDQKGSSSSCESNPGCTSSGLNGDCCPTSDNVFLECCGR